MFEVGTCQQQRTDTLKRTNKKLEYSNLSRRVDNDDNDDNDGGDDGGFKDNYDDNGDKDDDDDDGDDTEFKQDVKLVYT